MEDASGVVLPILMLGLVIVAIAGMWQTFTKAGQPGWAVLIPFYNMIVLLQIAGKPIWWILLMFIPIVGLIVSIIVMLAVAENFGRSALFGLGLAFLGFIFFPVLGFGDAQYRGVRPA